MTRTTPRSGIICAGNWIVDIVHDIEQWPQKNNLVRILGNSVGIGGGAANVLSDLRSFKVNFPLIPVGKIGKDSHADLIFEHCRKFGFPLEFIQQDETVPTAYTHVMNLSGDSRTFFYHGGANDTLTLDDIPMDVLAQKNAKLFYLGYPMLLEKLDQLQSDGTTQTALILKQARAAGMLTCVDLASKDSPNFKEIIAVSLPHIDYLIINETELAHASGMCVLDSSGKISRSMILNAARQLLDYGVNRALVVHSPELALWLGADRTAIWQDPMPVPPECIKSTVGAGDAFCAGILFGVHERWEIKKILTLAHKAARAALSGMTAADGIQPISQMMPEDLLVTNSAAAE